jgi:protein O-GlcNAc transferase
MATVAETLAQAERYRETGQPAAAEHLCRQVLQADPRHAEALHLLGILACQAGRYDDAAAHLEAAMRWSGADGRFHHTLGMVRARQGRPQEAIVCYQRALALQPDLAPVHSSLGNLYKSMGRVEEALACYDEALRLQPGLAEAHNNCGNLLKQLDRLEEAEASYLSAVRVRPGLPQPHYHLGLVQALQDRLAEAVRSYAEALRLWPEYAEAHIAQGDVLTRLSRLEEAEVHYRQALRLRPEVALVHYNLGFVLAARGQTDEAFACYEQALRLKPDYVDALKAVADALIPLGKADEAIAHYRRAIALDPEVQHLQSGLLFVLHYSPTLEPESVFAEHLRWGHRFGAVPAVHRPVHSVKRDSERRLRIGYVSSDFRDFVVGRYCEGVFAAHDHRQFEIFCYPTVAVEDERTKRIKDASDHWRSLVPFTDAEGAEQIASDQIDLLIDLSGHNAYNRLGVFARKPAPIQVSHFGYPDSTGLTAMNYRLTDRYFDPPDMTEHLYCEKLVRMPEACWCYVPWASPPIGPLPAQRPGAVTFAGISTLNKVTEEMLALWAQILRELPQARMLLVTGAGRAGDERVRSAFARQGIGPERVQLVGRQHIDGYLRLFDEVDIVLDTYPYTGCNTTADALWMGVPVISRAGRHYVARLAVSTLMLTGLDDLLTESASAYVKTAITLAQDLPRLRKLRAELRDRMRVMLGDVRRFTRQLEAVYRELWRAFCARNG